MANRPGVNALPGILGLIILINSRKHLVVFGTRNTPFAVSSDWFEESCWIPSYELDQSLATRMRGLLQRIREETSSIWR